MCLEREALTVAWNLKIQKGCLNRQSLITPAIIYMCTPWPKIDILDKQVSHDPLKLAEPISERLWSIRECLDESNLQYREVENAN